MRVNDLLALAVMLGIAVQTPAREAAAPQLPGNEVITRILQERIDTYKKSHGIVVGMIGPEGTRTVAWGKFKEDDPRKPDADSVYEIGSISKVFTSLLLADMVIRGEVELDDPLSKYLPRSVTMPIRHGKEITLLDLATHTSGLPRMPGNFHPNDRSNPYADYTVEQMYRWLSKCKLTRDAGAKYEYSNLGAGLLGHVLALRAGTNYETLLRQRITEPLGMASTFITLTPEFRARLVPGHNDSLRPAPNWDFSALVGAGAIRSTVNDMLKFLAVCLGYDKTPLAPAMDKMLEVRRPTGEPSLQIALAWDILSHGADQIVWHNGGTGGYHSFVGFDPKRRIGVVVLSNSTGSIDDIGLHILDSRLPLLSLAPPKPRKEIKLDRRALDVFVGRYQLSTGLLLAITRERDHLVVHPTDQPKFRLHPEGDRDFFLKEIDAQITFVTDQKGVVTHLILHQNGDVKGMKLP